MITELANLLDNFPGAANQTRCFAHIVNLVVKSILSQFDVSTKRNDPLDDTADEILKLAVDLDLEEELSGDNDEDGEQGEDDNYEGWIDERDRMSEEQLEELEDHVQPVRLLLIKACERKVIPCDDTHVKSTKLRKSAFAIKNSSTIILPKWFLVLKDLELDPKMMPRDVRTRWNSTFEMLDFAVKHREALDAIMGDRDMKLRQYELNEEDWAVTRQLRDVLKVILPILIR